MRTFFLICPLFFYNTCYAQRGSLDPELVKAYYHVLDLGPIGTIPSIKEVSTENTDDSVFQIYVRSLANVLNLLLVKDEAKLKSFEQNEKDLIDHLEDMNHDDPYVTYMKIELRMHRGLIKMRYGDLASGAFHLIQSFRHISEYEIKYPGYSYTLKTSGLLNVIISLFPDQLDWLLNLMQVNPDLNKGLFYLMELAESSSIYSREGFLLYTLSLTFFSDQSQEAEDLMKDRENEFNKSLLYRYLSGLISTKNRNNELAMKNFDACHEFAGNYMHIPLITYYRAESNLKALKPIKAAGLYKTYLGESVGGEFVKDCYFKLYNLAFIFKIDQEDSLVYKEKVLTEGSLDTGPDQYAYNKIRNNYKPDSLFFKARILFDGGYYGQSLKVLKTKSEGDFNSRERLSEYYYRLARNYQQLKQADLSIQNFKKAIEIEEAEEFYYWGNSLLHLGNIYSKNQEYELARQYYRQAQKYRGEAYRRSIRMEAKSGLRKIEGR